MTENNDGYYSGVYGMRKEHVLLLETAQACFEGDLW